MGNYGTSYTLKKGDDEYTFDCVSDVAEFLNVTPRGFLYGYAKNKRCA